MPISMSPISKEQLQKQLAFEGCHVKLSDIEIKPTGDPKVVTVDILMDDDDDELEYLQVMDSCAAVQAFVAEWERMYEYGLYRKYRDTFSDACADSKS